MAEERESYLEELDELVKQYFNEAPQAAERLLNYLIRTENYKKKVKQLVLQNTIGKSLAPADAEQEVYVHLLKSLRNKKFKLGGAREFDTWLMVEAKRGLIDRLRVGGKKIGYSDYGLLRSLTQRVMKQALQTAGIRESQLSHYLLAWNCFKEIYTPNIKASWSRLLQPPDSSQLEAIASRYNQLRCQGPEPASPAVNDKDIQALLQTCIQVARESSTIRVYSLDADDYVANLVSDDPLTEQAAQDAQEEIWNKVRSVLSNAFKTLPKDSQELLKLQYGLNLTQADIGKLFGGLPQYQVSRWRNKCKKPLLTALVEWSHQALGICLNSEQIHQMAAQMDDWLRWYCQTSFHEFLQATMLKELSDEVDLLRLYYGQHLMPETVASELNISEAAVNARLTQMKQHLQERLITQVQKTLPMALSDLGSGEKRIASLVEEWLNNAPYATL